jgi:hypothetical protein
MLLGEVGEGEREEIDRLPLDTLGLDFGWPCREGSVVPPRVALPDSCSTARLTPPIFEYPHSATPCSVTGGVVVRDPRLRALAGLYLWSDLCDGRIYGFSAGAARPEPSPLGVAVTQPTSFGTDGSGRVYVTTATGSLYRLDLKGGDGAGAR